MIILLFSNYEYKEYLDIETGKIFRREQPILW